MVDVLEASGALKPKLGLATVPTSTVSGSEIMAPYSYMGKAVGYLGERLEDAAVPFHEAAGAKAVTTDAEGNVAVNWRWLELSKGDKAYNQAARMAGVATYRTKVANDLQKLHLDYDGDPAAFDAAAKGYIKTLGKSADALLRPFVESEASSLAGQHFRGLMADKERTDTARFAKDLDARESYLTDQLESLAEQGGVDTDEFRAKQAELLDLRTQRAQNPKFTYSPEQANIDNARTGEHLKALSIVGQYRRQYLESGDLAGTLKSAEERLNAADLNLTPEQRSRYLGAITARTQAAAAVRSETIRQATESADLFVSALQNEDKVDARALDETIATLRQYRQFGKVAQLEAARLVSEVAPVLRTGTAVERTAAMARLRTAASSGQVQTASLLKEFEGFRSNPYWDVNAHRVGYGSDTVTRADGSVVRVTPGMTVTREDAERDLSRRIDETQQGIRQKIGDDVWGSLSGGAQTALTSIAYNYGELPNRVATVIAAGGDAEAIARAVEGLKRDNDGVNSGRRQREADIIRGNVGGGPVYAAAVKQLQAKFNDAVESSWTKLKEAWDDGRQPTQDEIQNVIALAPLMSDPKKRQEIAERFEREARLERVDGQSVVAIRAAVDELNRAAEAGELPPADRALLDGLAKREENLSKKLRDDPLSLVNSGPLAGELGTGLREAAGPLRFDSVDTLKDQLQKRSIIARTVSNYHGEPLGSVLRPEDVPQVRQLLQSGDAGAVSAFFSAIGGLDSDSLFATLSDKKLAQTVEGIAKTTDYPKYTAAMSGMDQLLRRNPDAFVAAFGADAVAKVQGWQSRLAWESPDEGAKRLAKLADGRSGKILDEMRAEAREWAKKKGDEAAISDLGVDAGARASFLADYRQIIEDANIEAADPEAAHKAALITLKTLWRQSPTNGGKVMKHAPEQYYPSIDRSHDWMAAQLRETLITRLDLKPTRVGGKGGSVEVPPQVPEHTLVATPDTQADIAAGRPPRYQVVYKNPTTGRLESFDARFNVDRAMAPVRERQQKAQEQDRRNLRREQTNDDVNAGMPGFAPVDPVTRMPQ